VSIQAAQTVKQRIKEIVAPTQGSNVLGGIGAFGAMYRLSGYREPVLVSSTDGVGTKVKLGVALGSYEGLGEDVVNACVNDVIVCGAEPLFFLDYIGMGNLEPDTIDAVVRGMVRACQNVDCSLIGGETAQLPGMYDEKGFELVGFAVGVVEQSAILDGSSVREGDLLIGIPSNGPHTNGYSLVRKILHLDDDPSPLMEFYEELGRTLGEALLEPHLAYYPAVRPALGQIKGMAHITGGGLIENVPRVLPDGLSARFDTAAWQVPPIFTLLQEWSTVSREEMYRVFNMGLGMVLVCDRPRADEVVSLVEGARVVGSVINETGGDRVIL